MKHSDILEQVRQSNSNKVKLAITDIDGILRGKYIHLDKFFSAVEGGFGFCDVIFGWDSQDVCYDNVKYTGWHTGYPDALAQIDLSTFRRIPWEKDIPFFLADFHDGQGKALEVCPRQVLKSVIKKCESMGLSSTFALEFEWFNFLETSQSLADKGHANMQTLTPGMFGYSVLRTSQNRKFMNAIMDKMLEFDIPVEGLHTETGPGVYEAAIQYTNALEAADRGVLFKTGTKEIAHKYEIMPTFMAKWNSELPGCSGHIHQSLWNEQGENVFYDANQRFGMSDTFKHYLAGQMHCLPDILPFFAPNVNSYKRLVEGHWAPTHVTWAADNRTSSLRVIPGSEKSTRLETRVGGADINPYLGIAASLASGLYGIENKLELPSEPVEGNAYEAKDSPKLPSNLLLAAEKMASSSLAKELFGEAFIDHFANTRIWEWRQFQAAVTNWELQRYFEII